MNLNQRRNIRIRSNCSATSEDMFYEDDGFFSDVPASGSLSKSQIALNRYVKKNLLFDESENAVDDSAYFSKESSPNQSVSKCDSESGKSNESFETKLSVSTDIVGNANTTPEIQEKETKAEPIDEIVANVEQTDDYKSMQILEMPNKTNVIRNDYHNGETFQKHSISTSLTDLPKSTYEKERPRENSDTKREENRHTLHDFSEWVNRTTTYPDVYAPLPYSEYYTHIVHFFVTQFSMPRYL